MPAGGGTAPARRQQCPAAGGRLRKHRRRQRPRQRPPQTSRHSSQRRCSAPCRPQLLATPMGTRSPQQSSRKTSHRSCSLHPRTTSSGRGNRHTDAEARIIDDQPVAPVDWSIGHGLTDGRFGIRGGSIPHVAGEPNPPPLSATPASDAPAAGRHQQLVIKATLQITREQGVSEQNIQLRASQTQALEENVGPMVAPGVSTVSY